MKIEKASLADAKLCKKLRAVEEKKPDIDFESSVKSKSCILIVAKQNKSVVGYCVGFIVPTNPKESMLHETRVAPSKRRSGIGKALVRAYCKEAFSMDVRTIYAFVENKHMKFYRDACGFKKNNAWIELKKNRK